MKIGMISGVILFAIAVILIIVQIIFRFLKIDIAIRLLMSLYVVAFTAISACVLMFTMSYYADTQPYTSNSTRITISSMIAENELYIKNKQHTKYSIRLQTGSEFKAISDNRTKRIKDEQKYIILDDRRYKNPYPKYIPNPVWEYFSRDTLTYIQEIHY